MMTASVAMGVAVDDTIHFLSWFRAHLDEGMSRVEAVIQSYRRVGPAMTQTTIVGGLGLFVFALSTFTPTPRFGTLMLVMLAADLAGDLILLPALLAGPAGRFFKPRDQRTSKPGQFGSDAPSISAGSDAQNVVVPVSIGRLPEVPQLRSRKKRKRRTKLMKNRFVICVSTFLERTRHGRSSEANRKRPWIRYIPIQGR